MTYWDYLGWRDTVGLKRADTRQRRYKAAHKMRVIGTPWFHVDNEHVRARQIRDLVDRKAKEKIRVAIDLEAKRDGETVKVNATLDARQELPKDAAVFAVLYRKKLTTDCKAGECRGMRLVEYYAVVAASEPVKFDKTFTAALRAPKGAKDLGVALLVEDRRAMKTIDCTALDLPR